jgi:hypothetical protein
MMVESLGGVFDADKLKALGDKPQMNELLGLMMDGFHEALGDLAGLGRLEDPEDDE